MLDVDLYQQLKKEMAANGDTWAMGDLFEKRTAEMFPDEYFSIVQYTPRREDIPGRICENARFPDFLFRDRITDELFWVECKYRSNNVSEKIKICDDDKLQEYRDIKEYTEIPLFFVIGIGEDPSEPEKVILINIDNVHYGITYRSLLSKYELERFSLTSLKEVESLTKIKSVSENSKRLCSTSNQKRNNGYSRRRS